MLTTVRWLCVALALLFLCVQGPAEALRIAVVPGVTYSHFSPAAKLVEKLEQRGHECLLFVPLFAHRQCRSYFRTPQMCAALKNDEQYSFDIDSVELGETEVFQLNVSSAVEYNRFLVDALSRSGRLHSFAPHVFVADFGAFGVDAVAEALASPIVFLWWHQALFPTDLSPSVPRLGSGRDRSMPFFTKVKNWAEKSVQRSRLLGRAQRAQMQYIWRPSHRAPPPLAHLVERRHVIVPGLLGVDLAIPTCPNIHRVGFLHSESERRLPSLPTEWKKWVDSCLYGVIYVSVRDEVAVNALRFSLGEIADRFGTCILWKTSVQTDEELPESLLSPRTRIIEHLPFSHRLILSHRSTKLVITQCGQSTVQEAVDTETAILCVRTGDSNIDLLRRIEERMVGDVVDPEAERGELTASVLYLFNNSRVFEAIRRVKRMGYLLGGTQHAAEIVELVASLGRDDRSFFCNGQSFTLFQVFSVLAATFTATLLLLLIVRCCTGTRQSKVKVD